MTPTYATVMHGYPLRQAVPPAALLAQIGWDEHDARHDESALRVSVALLNAGKRIPGRVNVSRGSYRGLRVEPGPARLALLLTHPSMLGHPEKFTGGATAQRGIGQRRGIVALWNGPARGSRIALLGACGQDGACLNDASEVWFWHLP